MTEDELGMTPGMRGAAESMFSGLLQPGLPDAPGPDDMEKARDAALYNKIVKMQGFNVKTFDLSDTKERNAYTKQMLALYNGIRAHTHALLCQDRRFVEGDEKGPRWVTHLEWAEFELEINANPTLGDTDGEDGT